MSNARLSAAGFDGRKLVGASASRMKSTNIPALRATSGATGAAPTDVPRPPARREVGQPGAVEQRVLRPRRIGEAPVLGVDLDRRLQVGAERLRPGHHRYPGEVVGQLHGRPQGIGRVRRRRGDGAPQRVQEARRVQVLQEPGLGAQHARSAFGDIAGRVVGVS